MGEWNTLSKIVGLKERKTKNIQREKCNLVKKKIKEIY